MPNRHIVSYISDLYFLPSGTSATLTCMLFLFISRRAVWFPETGSDSNTVISQGIEYDNTCEDLESSSHSFL